MPRNSSKAKDHQEELEELQKRFSHLVEQQKSTELSNSTLLLATRKSEKSLKGSSGFYDATEEGETKDAYAKEMELLKLDEQIVSLRRKHDQLHEKNAKKREELDLLADKLRDLHNTKFDPKVTPESRLAEMEQRLAECAARYDEEHRLRMSYDQVINRLKSEQLEWPAEVKQLETVLAQKEQDYEQLLVMSHDANSSKESAKAELSKFEALVLEERKQREKELQERRAILQKKQQIANELERTERERRQQLAEQQRMAGEDGAKEATRKVEEDIKIEQAKIRAYEAAFQQIKEATGVADVNEVIQRFTLQEETHQNLISMTKESQARIDELRRAVEEEKHLVMAAEYSRESKGASGSDEDQGRSSTLAAQKQLNRARERGRKTLKISTSVKNAVQHIVDVLEPLREKDEVVAPMSDDTLLQHMAFVESKLAVIAAAFAQIEEEHKELLTKVSGSKASKPPATLKKEATATFGLPEKDDDDDDDFEEDMEEEVMDRSSLKKQSENLVDKASGKKKGKKKKA
ncbi:neurofilament triplet l [Chrysochromulina tobinii]|uniref:Neurofilament triplet l n=1 Tax=Chrysochromulina tobinii TaxID=1460289 RepID=A0A0M0JMT9_9EUKA|nr:neurofilament triplet l [Chrysochromulina tobinii]|eukprot:KOO27627.1 neurofilament triplet l [Chrysochromulina sp. CCMP291]